MRNDCATAPQRGAGRVRPMNPTRLTLILAVALCIGAPAAAQAKAQQATFKATLSGGQVTTWEYHTPLDENNPCSASSDGYGDQTIKFNAGRSFKITFTKPPKG